MTIFVALVGLMVYEKGIRMRRERRLKGKTVKRVLKNHHSPILRLLSGPVRVYVAASLPPAAMYWENPMQYLLPPPRAQIKVILLGDQGVGKTSLVKQYVDKSFSSEYTATVGADFVTKEIAHEETTLVTVQIWDTAGEERFNSLDTGYHRDVDGCVIVFDINKRKTFANIDKWYSQCLEQVETWDRTKLPFLLIGNKIDKDLGVYREARKKDFLLCLHISLRNGPTGQKLTLFLCRFPTNGRKTGVPLREVTLTSRHRRTMAVASAKLSNASSIWLLGIIPRRRTCHLLPMFFTSLHSFLTR
ncbi:hypothetical protein HPP92_023626 [Vanilla planifolia]|uniref:Uncharacterized protein n=1 Tax=Vanilla planifolia TaxID=51239 RepID=A0A835PR75_VANPL|nr:hypothetical protein HPP92_023626 [Vanilla planifolia]